MRSSLYFSLSLGLQSAVLALANPVALASSQDGSDSSYPVRLLYQYPKGVWVENIAVRETGELLLTLFTVGRVDTLDPLAGGSRPQVIHQFPNTSAMGIGEIQHDIFAVSTGNYNFTSGLSIPGTWGVWTLDFTRGSHKNATARKVSNVPDAITLDGLGVVPSKHSPYSVVVGDLKSGKVYQMNTTNGVQRVILDNNYTAAAPVPFAFGTAGVNGLRVRDGHLYFTNSGTNLFTRVPIRPDGTVTGSVEVIAKIPNPRTQYYDDFTFNGQDAYLVTGSGNSVEKLELGGKRQGRIIAGSLNSTQFAEPTSCAFGRTPKDSHILYVTTGGGLLAPVNGNITVGGQILAIDTRQWHKLAI